MSTRGGVERVAIVGGGPAGAFLARLLVDAGYKVKVFEGAPRYAFKACGWGVPHTIERVFRIPEDIVLVKITGYEVYVGERLSKTGRGRFYGYIIDKERLISSLLEGVDVERRWVDPGRLHGFDLVVDARGHAAYGGRKALALQVEGRVREYPGDAIRIHFLPDLVGYAWVFPLGDGKAKVGVGGIAGRDRLLGHLRSLARTIGLETGGSVMGSAVASGGLRLEGDGIVRIGEAAGAVMPLSGEGIRPSMITARALFESVLGRRSFQDVISGYGLDFNIQVQLGVLRALERSTPAGRIEIFEKAPVEVLECVTAGCVTKSFLAGALARWPGFFLKVARLGGLGGLARGSGGLFAGDQEDATL
ncbi:NAD(P)/FAD-dependent oxidoreductase [Infirmifilum lucidum]|uniref:NAD(P)/FAD-dependent oxidoreductase n=1 Tax=Infirmifilum lucidum TaxID=2776706 RepID=A0A7L9FHR1_9CREN|nr:NAD(P)/FAD-dependent oxidoreductase [Infirmifilum lucidum]QOJ79368.1 NAD(P)/FAD-dependent oxidoreductase [Infirmifilum lucidum]